LREVGSAVDTHRQFVSPPVLCPFLEGGQQIEARADSIVVSEVAGIDFSNIFVIMRIMSYSIHYYSASVQDVILGLPATLQARYIGLTDRMRVVGANLGEPHTKAMGNGLFELRLMGAEGIARVMYCTLSGRRIVMLHGFIKKTQKTPHAELEIAIRRMKEVKHVEAR